MQSNINDKDVELKISPAYKSLINSFIKEKIDKKTKNEFDYIN